MPSVGILTLPGANIHSVDYWVKRSGANCSFVDQSSELESVDCLILPGVGSFDVAMEYIENNGLRTRIVEYAGSGRTLLGICLGMQILFEGSDEGDRPGLSLIGGHVCRIPSGPDRVPNIGWRPVTRLGKPQAQNPQFFFMHSYGVLAGDLKQDPAASDVETVMCNVELVASVRHKNVFGFQYHPEKSYTFGDKLLKEILDEIESNCQSRCL